MAGFDQPERHPALLGTVTLVLTAAAGSLNAVTFFSDGVFAGTMTGNLILLGVDVGRGMWFPAVESVCAIGGYSAGLLAGSFVGSHTLRRLPWRNAVLAALLVELAVIVAVGAGWIVLRSSDTRSAVLVVGAALAMGIQAAALRYIGPKGTPTNFLTGTVTDWVAGLAEPRGGPADLNGILRIVTVALAAAAGAAIELHAHTLSYVLPAVLVVAAIVLMVIVIRANHGGVARGAPELPASPEAETRAQVG